MFKFDSNLFVKVCFIVRQLTQYIHSIFKKVTYKNCKNTVSSFINDAIQMN